LSEVSVHALGPQDVDAFIRLIEALAEYEHLDPPNAGARERLAKDATTSPPRFFALLAEVDDQPAGYAVFFETYSTFLALPTLYLEDLFVLPDFRGRGVGAALFRECAAEAVRRGCGRMEWQVLAWNDLAIGFYQHLGATALHDDWLSFRLTGEALHRLGAR
jgi:GNAT superfamily N-acetyltransferase